MTHSEIQKANPKINIIQFSKNGTAAITKAVEFTGNGYYILTIATATGRVLAIKGAVSGKAWKRKPTLV